MKTPKPVVFSRAPGAKVDSSRPGGRSASRPRTNATLAETLGLTTDKLSASESESARLLEEDLRSKRKGHVSGPDTMKAPERAAYEDAKRRLKVRSASRILKTWFAAVGGFDRDPVTGNATARGLLDSIERAIQRTRDKHGPWSLAYLEIPRNLKGVNARFGDAGANVLMHLLNARVVHGLEAQFGRGRVIAHRSRGPAICVLVQAEERDVEERLREIATAATSALEASVGLSRDPKQAMVVVAEDSLSSWTDLRHPNIDGLAGADIHFAVVRIPAEADTTAQALLSKVEAKFATQTRINTPPAPAFRARLATAPGDNGQSEPRIDTGHVLTQRTVEEGPTFRTFFDERRSLLRRLKERMRLRTKAAENLGLSDIDPTTGALHGVGRMPTIARAIEHVSTNPKARAVGVLIDIGNLSGLDLVLGRVDADLLFRAAVDIVREELEATGAKVSLFRHGGDELMAVVTGNHALTIETCERAITNAQQRIQEMSKSTKIVVDPQSNAGSDAEIHAERVSDIPHPKHERDKSYNGINLHFAVKAIAPLTSPAAADAARINGASSDAHAHPTDDRVKAQSLVSTRTPRAKGHRKRSLDRSRPGEVSEAARKQAAKVAEELGTALEDAKKRLGPESDPPH